MIIMIITTIIIINVMNTRFEWTILALAITSLGLKHDADLDSLKVMPRHQFIIIITIVVVINIIIIGVNIIISIIIIAATSTTLTPTPPLTMLTYLRKGPLGSAKKVLNG